MVNPIGQQRARDAYLARTEQAQAPNRAELDATRREQRTEPVKVEDSVQISDSMRALHRATEMVKNAPEVRAERVAELRQQIQTGTYSVSSVDLASKIINGSNGIS